jgi:hypothetical protein
MTPTATHTAHCIEMAVASISENNLDTINEREPGRVWNGWLELGRHLEAEIEAGRLTAETEAEGTRWLAEGNVSCCCEDRCGR